MKTSILGCEIDNLTMDETLVRIEEYVSSKKPHQHVVVNVDKIVKANRDPGLMKIINSCDLVNVDGMPVVWASRLLGAPLKERVAGVDLFHRLLALADHHHWRVFFLGAREEVVAKVAAIAKAQHRNLVVAGYRNGYWRVDQEREIVNQIRTARPDILFVAISSPKKEQFLGTYQEDMRVPFSMGVGGTFDVAAGYVSRAPRWMQRFGLEWFFRFLQEPRRMFRRYFIDDIYFFVLLAKALRGKQN